MEPPAPPAPAVDLARQQLLARPALADEQHRGRVLRHALDPIEHLGERAAHAGDARAQFDRLQQRFPIELSGFSPIIQQAESNGRTIYRIRVGPLSKQDADALCARLKAGNGECFRAKPES